MLQTPPKHFSLIRSAMGFIRVSACALWGKVSCTHPYLWGLSRAKQCRDGFLLSCRKILSSKDDIHIDILNIHQSKDALAKATIGLKVSVQSHCLNGYPGYTVDGYRDLLCVIEEMAQVFIIFFLLKMFFIIWYTF